MTTKISGEQENLLAAKLEEVPITSVALAELLRDLDDLEDGRGNWPSDWAPTCKKCDEEIERDEIMGIAFGSYYHDGCVPSVNDPMPLGQYLGGVENAV